MTNKGKWSRRIMALLLIAIAGVSVAYTWGLPWIVRARVARGFKDAGFANARFRVTLATLRKTCLRDIVLDRHGQLRIGKVIVTYAPLQGITGKIKNVTVYDLGLTLRLKEHRLDWGPLRAFRSSPDKSFRFQCIRIVDGRLIIKPRVGVLPFKFSGRIISKDSACLLIANCALQDLELNLTARLNNATSQINDLDLRVTEATGNSLAYICSRLDIPSTVKVSGPISLQAHAQTQDGTIRGSATILAKSVQAIIAGARVQTAAPRVKVDFAHTYVNQGLADKATFTIKTSTTLVRSDSGMVTTGPFSAEATAKLMPDKSVRMQAQCDRVDMSVKLNTWAQTMALALNKPTLDLKIALGPNALQPRQALATAENVTITTPDYGFLKLSRVEWKSGFDNHDLPFNGSGSAAAGVIKSYLLTADLGRTTLMLNGNQAKISLAATLPVGARVDARASIATSNSPATGRIDFKVPRFALKDKGKFLSRFLLILQGYTIDGNLAASGNIEFAGTKLTSSKGWIEIAGMDLHHTDSQAGMLGCRGVLRLSSLWPPISEANQRLRADRVFSGKLAGTNARVVFDLTDQDRVLLRHAECSWGGGKLLADNTLIWRKKSVAGHLPAPWQARLDLRMEAVRLQDLVDLFYPGHVKAKGRLYGHLPMLYYQGRTHALRLGNGILEARPAKGLISMSETDARKLLGIKRVVPLETADMDEAGRLVVLQALRDMQYNQLVCRFIDAPKGWYAQIDTSGKGLRGKNPFPIGRLRVNLRQGLERLINLAILNPKAMRGMLAGLLKQEPKDKKAKQEKQEEDAAIDAYF